jgi:hypothetical protein
MLVSDPRICIPHHHQLPPLHPKNNLKDDHDDDEGCRFYDCFLYITVCRHKVENLYFSMMNSTRLRFPEVRDSLKHFLKTFYGYTSENSTNFLHSVPSICKVFLILYRTPRSNSLITLTFINLRMK